MAVVIGKFGYMIKNWEMNGTSESWGGGIQGKFTFYFHVEIRRQGGGRMGAVLINKIKL